MDSVVLISIDCLRADHVGCYGYDRPTTPNIDAFAENATIFEYSYSNCPGTRWAFQTIHTGISTIHIDGLGIPDGYKPLAQRFQDSGFSTFGLADNGFVSRDFGYETGFERYYSVQESTKQHGVLKTAGRYLDNILNNETFRHRILGPLHDKIIGFAANSDDNTYKPSHHDEHTVDQAIQFLTDNGDDPYFLWIHLMDAHTPYGYWPDHLQAVRGDTPIEHIINPGKEGKITAGEDTPSDVIDTYDACIRHVDEQIGRLLNHINDDATIVLTGDHGEEFGRYGEFHEASLFSSMTQVPIIVRSPELEAGRTKTPAQHLDIPPTLLYAGGIEVPPEWEGSPLQTLNRAKDEPIFFALGPERVGVRQGDWKLIESNNEKYLYEIPHHASETAPTDNRERMMHLSQLVDEYREKAQTLGKTRSELGKGNLSEVVEENLEDLGYL